MLQPTIPGWRAETLGDDIAWMRFGKDGRLYAVNPEFGFFGVAPGTNWKSNPNAMRTIEAGNTVFTNVALTDDNDVWWEGLEGQPEHLIDWKGNDWYAGKTDTPAAHPNSRYCTPMSQCPILAPEWDDPQGVPISGILFGARRKTTVPLVTQARDWQHGVFMGATMGSEQTAAAEGKVGTVRRDPMAMLPFLGYHVGDYFQHWIDLGKNSDESKLPKVFFVNWFRRGDDGGFLWPGFGENSRVLKWIVDRIEHKAGGQDTPIGIVPKAEDLDLDGLDVSVDDVAKALAVNPDEWREELPQIEEWFEFVGEKLPTGVRDEFEALKQRLSKPADPAQPDSAGGSAGLLLDVHQLVGAGQQFVHAGGVEDRCAHQADAGREPVGPVTGRVESRERLGEPLPQRGAVLVAFGDHHAELVAADAGQDVGLAPDAAQHLGDVLISMSPASWPCSSLTCLSPSTSRKASTQAWPSRCEPLSFCPASR